MSAPGRVWAVLALGMVLGLGSVGTAARWTDTVAVTGTTFTSGTIDLQVNDANAATSTTLSMTDMTPGVSSAEVCRVANQVVRLAVLGALPSCGASS
jgi:predicted ribosomally synthesized peptide with SipW-like signal peptide